MFCLALPTSAAPSCSRSCCQGTAPPSSAHPLSSPLAATCPLALSPGAPADRVPRGSVAAAALRPRRGFPVAIDVQDAAVTASEPVDVSSSEACVGAQGHPSAAPPSARVGRVQAAHASLALIAAALSTSAAALADEPGPGSIVYVPGEYVPSPVEVGWEIWFGAAAGTFPFVIGAYEFTKRIVIQRRCPLCRGCGLVQNQRDQLVKCPECGGFFPWQGWSQFLSAAATPGNGGVLQQPQGQTAVLYEMPKAMPTEEEKREAEGRYYGVRPIGTPKRNVLEAREWIAAWKERAYVTADK